MADSSVDDLKGDIEIPLTETTNLKPLQKGEPTSDICLNLMRRNCLSKITPTIVSNAMAVNLSNIKVRDWFQRQRDSIKPWSEFLNSKKFRPPKSVALGGTRILKNVASFQSNYLFVFLGLLIFCLLTSPVLLIAMAACLGACYIINLKNADKKIVIMGKEVSLAQQYAAVGVLSFPLFWVAGAGSAVFWVIGASLFCVLLHASMYSGGDEQDPFELEMETV